MSECSELPGVVESDPLVNLYYTGAHYDQRYATYQGDIAHYVSLACSAGPDVLELAVGTGRLAIPMAYAGAKVHGVDINESMLETARRKVGELPSRVAQRITLQRADMTAFTFEGSASLCVLACSSITHAVTDEDLRSLLACVRTALGPGGTFALDTFVGPPAEEELNTSFVPRYSYDLPEEGHRVVVVGRKEFDPVSGILTDHMVYTSEQGPQLGRVRRVSRVRSEDELVRALHDAGFTSVSSGFVDGTRTDNLVLTARVGGGPR